MKIIVETTVSEPIEKVWHLYNSPEHIVNWNAASDDWHTTSSKVDLREGGHFSSRMEAKDGSFGFDFSGVYTKIIENQFIAYTFGDRIATITFSETPNGVQLRIEFDSEETHSIEQQKQGWQAILENFNRYVGSIKNN